jgi:hypothetical protein
LKDEGKIAKGLIVDKRRIYCFGIWIESLIICELFNEFRRIFGFDFMECDSIYIFDFSCVGEKDGNG